MATAEEVYAEARLAWRPPPKMSLSSWLESNLVLPSDVSALPGRVRLYPPQRGIADAISDPEVERVTVLKGVRVGYSTLLTGAVASFVSNDPCPILCVLPTEADARDFMVSDIEPIFRSTPGLRETLTTEKNELDRNTLLSRRFPGGNLKVVAAKSPRNLRRHNSRILMIDECDAFETESPEGDIMRLAERRTLSFNDRKIICGSTPVSVETSYILRAFAAGDQRVYECPCPSCGVFSPIEWKDIRWDENKPETAQWACPSCGVFHDESHKPGMVHNGRWRATSPHVKGHASFKLTALTSLLAKAAWPILATEFVEAKRLADKGDTSALQAFVTTALAEGWRGPGETLDDARFSSMMEQFNLDTMPPVALYLFAGVDVQGDRLEISICGFDPDGICHVLSHQRIWGVPDDMETWHQLSQLLAHKWKHPWGGLIGISATCIDSGFATEKVYDYCFARTRERVWAVKGMPGSRPAIQRSTDKVVRGKSTRNSGHLWLIGTHTLKMMLFRRMQSGNLLRFSAELDQDYFEMLQSERITTVYRGGRSWPKFELISGRENHAFDTLVYCHAARASFTISDWAQREADLRTSGRPLARPSLAREIAGFGT